MQSDLPVDARTSETAGGSGVPESTGFALDDTPERIGPYRILREIGRGGVGAVYLAERDDQFRKRVAIKRLKTGMDSHAILQRFHQERQLLAWLEHPNIAHVLDGGATSEGRPYFVMEHIDGVAITAYCRDRKLSITKRLRVFQQVCAAVSYAHRSLIVHRDLKPANILVLEDGTPKLLDFGIAKVLRRDDGNDATETAFQMLTPAYASPEQIRGGQITVATDIYSLGLILYEMLAGTKAYDVNSLSASEASRTIVEVQPPPPSTVAPAEFRKTIRGDLDNIVLMALRKDPQRRYASVEQFAEDIARFLDARPVIARSDTWTYRVGKFVSRNRVAVLTAVIAGAVALTTLSAAIVEARRANRRLHDMHRLANSFVFEVHDAIEKLPGSTAARAMIVKRALEYLDGLAKDAGTDFNLQLDVARAYKKLADVQGNDSEPNLGDTHGSSASYIKAASILEGLHHKAPGDQRVMRELAEVYSDWSYVEDDHHHGQNANQLIEKAIELRRSQVIANPDDAEARRGLARGYFARATKLVDAEHYEEAKADLERAESIYLDGYKANPEDRKWWRPLALVNKRIGGILGRQGLYDESVKRYQRAAEIDEKLVNADPMSPEHKLDLSFDYGDLGWIACQRGDHRTEVEQYKKVVAMRQAIAAADPHDTRAHHVLVSGIWRLGRAYGHTGDYRQSFEMLEKTVNEYRKDPSQTIQEAAPDVFQDIQGNCKAMGPARAARERLCSAK